MTVRPLKVLTIGHSYVVGLNQAVPAAIARDPSIELTLAAPTFHYGDLRRIFLEITSHPDYEVVPIPAYLTRWNQLFWYRGRVLRNLVRGRSFDVVHAWEEPYSVSGNQIARVVGPTYSKFLFRTAQSIVKSYPWPFSVFERGTLKRANAWVAGGGLVYDAMVKKGFPADKGREINLGVDMERFYPFPVEERDAVRSELGLVSPVVGFVGRLVPAKGLNILMGALELLQGDWSLLALGSGPSREELLRWADRNGWADRVKIVLAKHDDMPRYLSAIDVLAAPSQTMPNWKEQFGRMVIEAFACRVPVVGSDSGEIPYVIGDSGVIVPESDVNGWAEALQRLLEDPALREELAGRGYARCREKYSTTRIAQHYVSLYHELSETQNSPVVS